MERQVGLFPGVKIHCFDYYMDQQISFGNAEELNNPSEWRETVLDGRYIEEEITSIGRSKSTNLGGGASVNLGIGNNFISKVNTFGGNKNFSLSNLKDKVQLIDLNGDGIIDKLVRDGNNYNYYKGELTDEDKLNFNGPYSLNLPTLGKSWTFSNNTGEELYCGLFSASGVATHTYTESKQYCNDYFADVNGDGYLDFVRDGNVYFNFPDIEDIPYFTLNGNNNTVVQSADDTCYVIHYDGVLDSSVVIDTIETIENIDIKRDPVKMWIAPEYLEYQDKSFRIKSQIQRILPQSDNSVIYYYVQHNDNIIMLDSILPTDMNMYTYDTCLYISRNDRIYFRMHSKDGGKVDDIYWDPEIIFGGGVYGDCNMPIEYKNDADEKHIERFKYSEDAIIHDKQYFIAPDTGTVMIDVSISSPAQSDSVRFQIIHNDTYLVNNGYIDAQPFSYANTIYRNVMPGDSLFFKLNSNTNINWNDIDFYAKISYIDITDIPDTVPNNPPIRTSHEVLDYVYYPSLHMSIYPRIVRESYSNYLDSGSYTIIPKLYFIGDTLNGPSGNVFFTVKTKRNLILKAYLHYNHGQLAPINPPLQFTLAEGDTVYFDYYTDNLSLADSLISSRYHINNYSSLAGLAGFYSVYPDSMAIYGNLYRGWGQFSYYGNTSTIDESALIIDQTLVDTTEWANFPFSDIENNMYTWDFDTLDSNFMNNFNNTVDTNFIQNIYNIPILPMQANRENDKWVDMFNIAYCDYTTMGYQSLLHSIITSFINMDTTVFQSDDTDIPVFGSVIPGGNDSIYNTKVINKYSEQYTNSFSVNVGLLPFSGLTKSRSRTQSFGFSDFMDFNGDRYPDIINKGKIQYTNSHGGLSNYIYNTEHKYLTKSISESKGNSYGVKSLSMVNTKPNGGAKSKLDNINGNFGIGNVDGLSDIQYMYVDINGDGLPDRINVDEGNHSIELNLGYSFINIPPNIFNLNIDTLSKNESNSNSLNLGVNLGNYSISAGIGGGLNESTDKYSLMDINNDGFVDLCYLDNNTLKVYYNNGSSFLQNAQTIDNISIISKNKSYNIGANGSFTVGVPLFPFIKLTGTPYADLSFNFSTDRARLTDINGDGFIDYIYINDLGETKVNYGIPQKTNILKEVKTPTGAKYFCNYELKYPEKDNPSSKWVLASLKVYDGFVGDGADTTYYKFKYDKPKYHRMERESFGYETVTTEQYNNSNHIYRVVIEKYHNQDFLFKGLKKYEVNYDGMAQKYVETEYKWDKKEITTGKVVIDSLITCFGPYYPAISMETKRYYEGHATPSIITKKLYEHGQYGNVIRYENKYDSSYVEDELIAEIHYTTNISQHFLEMADDIKVYDYQNQLLQHREASYNINGKMSQMRVFNNTDIAYTDLQYDQYGNVTQILYPHDVNGDRLKLEYEYDQQIHTYPTKITDFWDNSMTTYYDYRLGLPTKVIDPSDNMVTYEYYEDGKLNTVTAPNEINNGAPYTIKCDYWTNYQSSLSNNTGLWAQTLHYDPINVGNEFETVTISDGLGRAIQVKKKSTINGVDSVIVSGKIIFDAFGRKITEYQPETEAYSGTINHNYSNLSWQNPTTYSYDIMDRPIQQNNPDGTHINYSYNFGIDNFGKTCFKTNITDPNGKVTEQYKDARGLQTTVVAPMNTITSFIYTSLGQIKTSIDPEYNNTNYSYDMLGRLIEREHPDAGITQYDYDMAGNIIKKMSENSDIEYRYQEGRLANIHYPGNEEMDVYYEYGAPGTGNQSGRLIKQQDASGVQTFWYGNMGELIGNKHTYVVPGGEAYSFEMRWQYDSWNRLRLIQYPDGETVNYYYDNGGKLMRMNGVKSGNEYNYINRIFYDKYDSRVHIDYGNNTYSDYSYDPLNRRLINLKSYNHSGLKMQDIVYNYDEVGNIINQSNNGEYVDGEVGGPYNYNYQYDDLYRLIGAGGAFISYQFGNIGYNMAMSYSPSGNITNKQINGQTLINGGVNNINYNRDYFYDSRPHQVTKSGENTYEWDNNGNMIRRYGPNGKRSQCWDNEDRLTAVNDMGSMPQLSAYLYDGGGERVWKLTGGVMQNYMNGQQIYNSVHLDKTLYASPYMVMTEQEYTKHYYIEGERICSKIGGGFQWAHTPPTSTPIDFIADDPHACSMHLREMVDRNTQCAEYDGEMDISPELAPAYNNGNEYENLQYFYHPDHLGSASFVTNAEGAVCQHLQYLPFGEIFVSQRNCEFDSRYKFTAKELDNETSYTYFGARYYDADLSSWLSVDPLSDKYPSLSPYCYSADNPVVLMDPNGLWIDDYYFNTETKQISVIKTNDNFDRLIMNGEYKGTYNKGYLSNVANSCNLFGYSFNELEIKYAKNVDQSKISYYTRSIIVDAMNKSKNFSILITSGTRTPEDQARIMKYYVDLTGMEKQKKLYGPSGDKVLDYYPDQKAMTDEIYRLGPSKVSKHCGDPNEINVLDISPINGGIKNPKGMSEALENDTRVNRVLTPYNSNDKAIHIEINQNQ